MSLSELISGRRKTDTTAMVDLEDLVFARKKRMEAIAKWVLPVLVLSLSVWT